MYIVSAKFENVFVAPDALQQNKSGPRSKRLGTTGLNTASIQVLVCNEWHSISRVWRPSNDCPASDRW